MSEVGIKNCRPIQRRDEHVDNDGVCVDQTAAAVGGDIRPVDGITASSAIQEGSEVQEVGGAIGQVGYNYIRAGVAKRGHASGSGIKIVRGDFTTTLRVGRNGCVVKRPSELSARNGRRRISITGCIGVNSRRPGRVQWQVGAQASGR